MMDHKVAQELRDEMSRLGREYGITAGSVPQQLGELSRWHDRAADVFTTLWRHSGPDGEGDFYSLVAEQHRTKARELMARAMAASEAAGAEAQRA